MTPDRAKELKPVYDAFSEGKSIEWKSYGDPWWREWKVNFSGHQPSFLSPVFEWRTKPEPQKPRELTLMRVCNSDGQWSKWTETGEHWCPHDYRQMMRVREVVD